MKIAIGNPYYKLGGADEFYLLRVDCPEEIIMMHCIGESNQGNTNLIKSSEEPETTSKQLSATLRLAQEMLPIQFI